MKHLEPNRQAAWQRGYDDGCRERNTGIQVRCPFGRFEEKFHWENGFWAGKEQSHD